MGKDTGMRAMNLDRRGVMLSASSTNLQNRRLDTPLATSPHQVAVPGVLISTKTHGFAGIVIFIQIFLGIKRAGIAIFGKSILLYMHVYSELRSINVVYIVVPSASCQL